MLELVIVYSILIYKNNNTRSALIVAHHIVQQFVGFRDAHVYLVDYGTEMWRNKSCLMPLPVELAELPPAAHKIAVHG